MHLLSVGPLFIIIFVYQKVRALFKAFSQIARMLLF